MKPAAFRYFAPQTRAEALALLAEHGDDAKVLAGGQSLVPAMSFRLAQPAILVDLNGIDDLAFIEAPGEGGVRIGAMTRQRTVERSDVIRERAPLVAETLPHVAHPQIRNRGTFGGSLAHADPAAELPAVALATEARFRVESVHRQRTLSSDDFFTDLFATALEPGELLVEVALPPVPPHSGWAFEEIARRHGDYALVGVAATVACDIEGRIAHARLAFLSVGPGPVLARRAAESLVGSIGDDASIRAAATLAAHEDVDDPPTDIHATAAYRRHLIDVLTNRVLTRAVARASREHERK